MHSSSLKRVPTGLDEDHPVLVRSSVDTSGPSRGPSLTADDDSSCRGSPSPVAASLSWLRVAPSTVGLWRAHSLTGDAASPRAPAPVPDALDSLAPLPRRAASADTARVEGAAPGRHAAADERAGSIRRGGRVVSATASPACPPHAASRAGGWGGGGSRAPPSSTARVVLHSARLRGSVSHTERGVIVAAPLLLCLLYALHCFAQRSPLHVSPEAAFGHVGAQAVWFAHGVASLAFAASLALNFAAWRSASSPPAAPPSPPPSPRGHSDPGTRFGGFAPPQQQHTPHRAHASTAPPTPLHCRAPLPPPPATREAAALVAAANLASLSLYASFPSSGAPLLVERSLNGAACVPSLHGAACRVLNPGRYLLWSFSCSSLLLTMRHLAPACASRARTSRAAIVANILTIGLGAAEALARAGSAPQHALFLCSMASFAAVLTCQRKLLSAAAAAPATSESERAALAALARATHLTWASFPLVRVCVLFGLLGPAGAEVATTACDVTAKLVYTLFLTRTAAGHHARGGERRGAARSVKPHAWSD